jgi:16S rRNA (uracil1498-N3)-methyltransferase
MSIPFFYQAGINTSMPGWVLDEDTSKHVVQVLRMQNDELLSITDGKGNLFKCSITNNNRKRCEVNIISIAAIPPTTQKVAIAISPLKNNSRLEWFLEKATEIGVTEIYPLLCERTEKASIKPERLHGILVSAMLQSQQVWLPILQQPVPLSNLLTTATHTLKLIAHCEAQVEKKQFSKQAHVGAASSLILIGPEGDFTPQEIAAALNAGFSAVALGNTRLRTETAGIVAATILCQPMH